jgi:iron(III) transport system permease protein
MSLFSVALVMGADVLPTYIYRNATALGRPELAAIAALPLMVVAFALTIVQATMLRKAARFITVTGKGALGRPLKFHRRTAATLKGFSVVYVFLSGVFPIGAVAVASLLPFWKPRFQLRDLTTKQYGDVFDNALVRQALGNSVKLALVCALLSVALTFLLIVFAERLRLRSARVGLFVANIPLGIPAAVLGLGFLLAFIRPPFVLYGTAWLLFLAYLVSHLPISLRNVAPVIQQVSGELDEAARVHGAGKLVTIGRITLPLAAPGLASSFVLLFILIFREFPIATFVATPGTSMVSVVLLNFQETGRFPAVAVLAMLISFVSLTGIVLTTLVERLVKLRRS